MVSVSYEHHFIPLCSFRHPPGIGFREIYGKYEKHLVFGLEKTWISRLNVTNLILETSSHSTAIELSIFLNRLLTLSTGTSFNSPKP